jgi:hypothetical protein
MTINEPLTRPQERALQALLTVPTIAEAARIAYVTDRAIFKWLASNHNFKSAYLQARREAMGQVIGQLQQTATVAVQALREVLDDPATPHTAKVSAARVTLEMAIKGIETLDLEQRIERLEASIRVGTNGRQP